MYCKNWRNKTRQNACVTVSSSFMHSLRKMEFTYQITFSLLTKHGFILAALWTAKTGWVVVYIHIFKELLHPKKVGVWCTLSCCCVVGPLFFEDRVDGNINQDITTNSLHCWMIMNMTAGFSKVAPCNVLQTKQYPSWKTFFVNTLLLRTCVPPRILI
jgi:hypothetical protein